MSENDRYRQAARIIARGPVKSKTKQEHLLESVSKFESEIMSLREKLDAKSKFLKTLEKKVEPLKTKIAEKKESIKKTTTEENKLEKKILSLQERNISSRTAQQEKHLEKVSNYKLPSLETKYKEQTHLITHNQKNLEALQEHLTRLNLQLTKLQLAESTNNKQMIDAQKEIETIRDILDATQEKINKTNTELELLKKQQEQPKIALDNTDSRNFTSVNTLPSNSFVSPAKQLTAELDDNKDSSPQQPSSPPEGELEEIEALFNTLISRDVSQTVATGQPKTVPPIKASRRLLDALKQVVSIIQEEQEPPHKDTSTLSSTEPPKELAKQHGLQRNFRKV